MERSRENFGDVLEREPLEKEVEVSNFIEASKRSVPEALSGMIKDSRFVLVGEMHTGECEPVRHDVVNSLARLQREGLTHVALELKSDHQRIIDSLDYSDPDIKKVLDGKNIRPILWSDGNWDILIEAKRLGLKVVLLDYDDGRPESEHENSRWQNLRDSKMEEVLSGQIDEESKTLILIGNDHVQKKELGTYEDGKTKRLGMRLSEKYGGDTVKSIRHVSEEGAFDGLWSFMTDSPTPKSISKGNKEAIIIPDDGPVKGDPRVTGADYIVAIV